jgi:Protein of unknown function (DUF1475)
MNILRLIYAALGIGLAALIIFAMATGDFWLAGRWLMSDPWGLTTMADLYLGFAISALIIALYERSWIAILWIFPLPILGNVWTVIWLAMKLPQLNARLLGDSAHKTKIAAH